MTASSVTQEELAGNPAIPSIAEGPEALRRRLSTVMPVNEVELNAALFIFQLSQATDTRLEKTATRDIDASHKCARITARAMGGASCKALFRPPKRERRPVSRSPPAHPLRVV